MTNALELMEDYEKKVLGHLNLKTTLNKLHEIESPSYKKRVVLLVGPSGVGKSTLIDRFERDMLERHRAEMLVDPSFIPLIKLTIPAPIQGDFDWKDAFCRILGLFNEVLINRKVISSPVVELDGEIFGNKRGFVKNELRRSIKSCIKHRRTSLIIIDEASHLLISKSRSTFLHQFELLKSLCEDFGITLLLSGAYDLLAIQEFNGQLIRRTEIIHFPRYSLSEVSSKESLKGESFRSLVSTLLELMPVEKAEDFKGNIDYFFMYSLGTSGLLKQWFQKALESTLRSPDRILTREILEDSHKSHKELQVLEKENLLGEKRLQDTNQIDLARTLGLNFLPTLDVSGVKRRIIKSETEEESISARSLPNRSSRIGTRAPARDVAGVLP